MHTIPAPVTPARPATSTPAAANDAGVFAGILPPPRPRALTLDQHQPSFGMQLDRDRAFSNMLRAYKTGGGLGRGDETAARFHECGGGVSQLARWIVEREVLSFEWQSELWLPWFQFDPVDMTVRADVHQVTQELRDTFDGWHLAQWFVEPNCWLGDRRPVDLIDRRFDDVLHAARTDRFVAIG